jgi:hypothetical protein
VIAHRRAVRLQGRAARIPISVDLDHASIFMSPTNTTFKSLTARFGSYRYLLTMQKWDVVSIGIAQTLAVATNVSR